MSHADIEAIVSLALDAWAAVFSSFREQLGQELFELVYPDWRRQQEDAVRATCSSAGVDVWVADGDDGQPVGFVALRIAREGEAAAGEIDMIAVDPRCQRRGIGGALMTHAVTQFRADGLQLVVIGTGGDPGHAPARAMYERAGFRAFPLQRYYLPLIKEDKP